MKQLVTFYLGPPEATGTANFCLMMDKFLDCLNVRTTVEHELKRKPFLEPYDSLLMIQDLSGYIIFLTIFDYGKTRLKRDLVILQQKSKASLFHGKLMKVFK